jgi:allantoin racemase
MKIWFQKHTVAGRLPGLDRAYQAHLGALVRPGTEIHYQTLPGETYQVSLPERYVRYAVVESLFAQYFALQALRAERAGYDAFVIGTSQDPGLLEARGWVDMPVLGYGETAAHVAALLGQRFGFVGFIPELAEPIATNIQRYGLDRRLAGFGFVASGPESVAAAFEGRSQPFLAAFHDAARGVIAAGAEVLVPADGLTNEILVAAGLRTLDGAVIIDANGLLVKAAELFVDLRAAGVVGRPGRGYHHLRPTPEHAVHLLRLFAPRAFELGDVE